MTDIFNLVNITELLSIDRRTTQHTTQQSAFTTVSFYIGEIGAQCFNNYI